MVFWVGAVLVALMAIAFATLAGLATNLFVGFQAPRPWVAFIVCPVGFAASYLLTRHVFPGAQGSGIPQVIAVQHMTDPAAITAAAIHSCGLSLRTVVCGVSRRCGSGA